MDLPVAILDRLDDKFQGIEGKGRRTSAPENGADADCGAGSRLQQVEPGVPPLASSLAQVHVLRSHTCPPLLRSPERK